MKSIVKKWKKSFALPYGKIPSLEATHLFGLYPYLRAFYYFLWAITFSIALSSFLAFLPFWQKSHPESSSDLCYTRGQLGKHSSEERVGPESSSLMRALFLSSRESHDPAWIELRAFADCVGVNARPDRPAPLVLWKWSEGNRSFEIAEKETFYVTSETLRGSAFCEPELASSGFRMVRAFHEKDQMVVEIEILKKNKALFEPVESFKLFRPLRAQPQDSSLSILKRMQIKWYGPDLFLLEHGSLPERELDLTQNLEFGSGTRLEKLFLTPDRALVKEKQRLTVQAMGVLTQGLPIWVVEAVEPEGLRFRAWSLSGLYSETLLLPRQSESWQSQLLQNQISITGRHPNGRVSVRILNQRWNLQVLDWMLHTANGWIKIIHPQQVDDYVKGDLFGELLVLHSIESEGENWRADFELYSPMRSQKICFSLKQKQISSGFFDDSERGAEKRKKLKESPKDRRDQHDQESYFEPIVESSEDFWDKEQLRALVFERFSIQ